MRSRTARALAWYQYVVNSDHHVKKWLRNPFTRGRGKHRLVGMQSRAFRNLSEYPNCNKNACEGMDVLAFVASPTASVKASDKVVVPRIPKTTACFVLQTILLVA